MKGPERRSAGDSLFVGFLGSILLSLGVAGLYHVQQEVGLVPAVKSIGLLVFGVLVTVAWFYVFGEALHRLHDIYVERTTEED